MQVLNQHSTKSTPHSGLVCIYLSAGPARAERKIQSFAPGIGSPRGFFRGLLLTNLPSLRYNQSLQGCPCIYGHLPSVNRQKMPSIGETLKEGIRNEADFPAMNAAALTLLRLERSLHNFVHLPVLNFTDGHRHRSGARRGHMPLPVRII